jgi:type IV secretory pathway VirB10-like protein
MDKGFPAGVNAALALNQATIEDASGESLSFFPALGAILTWFFMLVLKIGVLGFVVSYIIGGSTAVYFALRRDVDGTEDSEIYIEGAEDEEDFGLPPLTTPAEDTAVAPAAEEETEEKEEEKAEEPKPAKKKAAKKKAAKKKAAKKKTAKKEEEEPSEEESSEEE